MTTIITGAGLGLFNTSNNVLGSSGNALSGRPGQSDAVYMNGTTGNLVVRAQDEFLSSTGLDTSLFRTYNSLGQLTDDNGDNWQMGFAKLINIPATKNATGKVTKAFGDGASIDYTFNSSSGLYVSTAGDGADDTLSFSSSTNQWTWTDGDSRVTEIYNASGQLVSAKDVDGNTTSYTYTGALLTQITDASGQSVFLDYTGNNLTKIREVSQGVTQTLVTYGYDSLNRLSTVTVDLTPTDNSIADGTTGVTTNGKTYVTTYTYDGTSKRIASITNGDGTTISFTYSPTGDANAGKVKTYTDGAGKTTTLTYTSSVGQTVPVSATANPAALTAAPLGWGNASQRLSTPTGSTGAQMLFDRNGNGIAVWATGTTLTAMPYTKNSRDWGSSSTINATLTGTIGTVNLSMSANGNALVTWVQNGNIYARRLINGVWDNTTLTPIETGSGAALNPVGAINDNGLAVVSFVQSDGTHNNLMVNVYNGSAWQSSASALDDQGGANNNAIAATTFPSVAIDPSGNAAVLWQQTGSDGNVNLFYSRYSVIANSWSNPSGTALENATGTVTASQIELDKNGNGVAVFVQGGSLFVSSFTQTTGTWSTAQSIGTSVTGAPNLSTSANGNALLTWVQSNSIMAAVYTGGAWGGARAVENLAGAAINPTGAINDAGQAVVVFVQSDGTRNNVYQNVYNGTAWAAAASNVDDLGGANTNAITATMVPSVTIDPLGDIDILWGQKTAGTSDAGDSIYSERFLADATPYYTATVTSTTTWQTIAQAIYGDSAAATALQNALPGVSLPSAGNTIKITVPPRLDYTKAVTLNQLDVSDPLGQVTTYFSDASGQLRQVLAPTVNGTRPTMSYVYDANGNVIEAIDPNGNVTTSIYDANDNLIATRDALGNTVTYTYSSANQVVTKTQYLVPDPDGSGAAQPGKPVTTRYVYDTENHLRFVVTAAGRVTESRYDTPGNLTSRIAYVGGTYNVSALLPTDSLTEAQLATWIGTQDLTKTQGTDYTYDFRGNVQKATSFTSVNSTGAGVADGTQSVTQFVYDQRGQLLQTIDARGSAVTPSAGQPNTQYATTYTYDGLGRMLSTNQWVSATEVRTTLRTSYDDVGNKATVTLANGLATTNVYDKRGLLISSSQANGTIALGTTTYQYDADGHLRITTDPLSNKTYLMYDADGRVVGTVDATGSVVKTDYDNDGNVVKTTAYATLLTSTQLATLVDTSGNPTTVTVFPAADAANDRVTRYVYDAANRLVLTIDPHDTDSTKGYVTRNCYDGEGRLTDVIAYATAITVPATLTIASVMALIKVVPEDRHSRNFYDNDGNLVGALDGEGDLCEYQVDGVGETVQTICYGTQVAPSSRDTSTFAQLKANVVGGAQASSDQHSYSFYDGEGRLMASLDAENYLTEYTYDTAGNLTQQKRYYTLASTFTGTPVLASIRPAANANDAVTINAYDGANELTSVTENPAGTVTHYTYDSVGNVIKTERAWNTTEVRTTQTRYDVQGRVLQELSANGSVALAALSATVHTQEQVDLVWSQYSTTYTYDQDGRRLSATDANGNRTNYYYDTDNRLRYAVDGLGEVAETRYNAFGEVTDTVQYTGHIAITGSWSPANLIEAVVGAAGGATGLQTAFDRNGNGVAVYLQSSNDLFVREYTAATATWSTSTEISNDNDVTDLPSVAMNANGDVAIAWAEQGAVRVARRVNGAWSGDANGGIVGTTGGPNSGVNPVVAINNSGEVAVAWLQSDGTRKNLTVADYSPGDGWEVENLDDNNLGGPNANSISAPASLALDDHGHMQILWLQKVNAADGFESLYSSVGEVGDGWTNTPSILVSGSGGAVTAPQIRYDSAGNVVAVWIQGGVLWSSVNFGTAVNMGIASGTPSLSMNGTGMGLLTWVMGGDIVASVYSGGVWGALRAIETLPGVAANPVGAINDNGQAAVVFVQDSGSGAGNHVYVRRYINGDWENPSGINGAIRLDPNNASAVSGSMVPSVSVSYTGDVAALWAQAIPGQSLASVYGSVYASTGGAVSPALTSAVNAIAASATDAHQSFNYTMRGAVKNAIEALNATTSYTKSFLYDAFGELASETDPVVNVSGASNTSTSSLTTYGYDHRGLLTKTVEDADNGSFTGIKRTTSTVYDAFGRAIRTTDGNGNLRSATYDKLGRTLTATDPAGTVTSTYDALGRVLTQKDALNNTVATYAYNDAGRSFTLTTAENIIVTTTLSRHGQTVSVVDGNGNTTAYGYDSDGNLISTTQAQGTLNMLTSTAYDHADRVITTTDARGIVTAYTYDAASRVLSRTVDPINTFNPYGVNLTTRYSYDGQGRTLTITDPRGTVTQTTYDAKGQVTQTAVDPSGLNLRTSYTYDADGHALTVISGAGSTSPITTQYVYDNLGRRIEAHVDPAGLNLTSTYVYDGDDNVTKVTDPNGNVTRHYYDGADRQIYVLDALNELTQTVYDADGRVIKQVSYANSLTGGSFPANPAKSDIDARIPQIADAARDEVERTVYDRDGRTIYSFNALGELTQNTYDGNGNVVKSAHYANRITIPATVNAANVASALTAAGGADATRDLVSYMVYDGANREIYDVNALGEVTQNFYDANGNVLQSTRYGVRIAIPSTVNAANVASAIATAVTNAGASALPDETSYAVYDGANRAIYTFNSLGELKQNVYDGESNVVQQVAYANRIAIPPLSQRDSPYASGNMYWALRTAGGPNAAADLASYAVYDAANREVYSFNALGEVTQNVYDANGNVTKSIHYANRITIPSTVSAANVASAITASAANDIVSYAVYDAADRQVYGFNALGEVTQNVYDANGNVTKSIHYANRITIPSTVSAANVASAITASAANDIVSYAVYDAADRQVYGFNALGEVTQNVYDANGNVTKSIHYANRITIPSTVSAANVASAITANAANDIVSYAVYDAADRQVYGFNALGEVTQNVYDANGNVTKSIHYANRITIPSTVSAANVASAITANAASDQVSYAVYDAANRQVYGFNALGEVTQNVYDANGNVTKSIHYANRITIPSTVSAANVASAITTNAASDQVSYAVYDAASREIYALRQVDANTSAVVANVYDAAGRVTQTRAFFYTISASTAPTAAAVQAAVIASGFDHVTYQIYDRASRISAAIRLDGMDSNENFLGDLVTFGYDANGNVTSRTAYANRVNMDAYVNGVSWMTTVNSVPSPTPDPAHDRRTRTLYDAAGRAIYVASDTTSSQEAVTKITYNAFGGVVERKAFSATIASSTAMNQSALDSALVAGTADRRVRNVYDAAGRVTYGADGAGAVTQSVYDAFGNVVKLVNYITPIGYNDSPSIVIASTGNDRITVMTYDNAGRQIFQLDALGDVTQSDYDAFGNVVRTVQYSTHIAAPTLAGAYTTVGIQGLLTSAILSDPNNRVSYAVYDGADRAVLSANGIGYVVQNQYDAFGDVVQTTAYATTVSLSGVNAGNAASVLPSRVTADATHDRVTRYQFDANNRLVATMDAQGYATQNTYDSFGQLSSTVVYDQPIATSTLPRGILTAVFDPNTGVSGSAGVRTTYFGYDQVGRFSFTQDALGNYEMYGFDGVGNKVSYRNQKGDLWNYDYDNAGRMIKETTPQVMVTEVTQSAAMGGLSIDTAHSGMASIVTTFGYDALGNLTSRTEAFGRPEQRTTTYDYDAAGHQIKITYPSVGVYNMAGDNLINPPDLTPRSESAEALFVQVTYDAFGNAISNLDVAGNRSYKTYDLDGQLKYEIDAEGGITGYQRNAFGEVTSLTRYGAAAPQTAASLTTAQVTTIVTGLAHTLDRTITTAYDVLGRAVLVTEPAGFVYDPTLPSANQTFVAGKTTRTSYNAFGQIFQVAQLKYADQSTPPVHANDVWDYITTNYYDQKGQQIEQVDALGYVTTQQFDAVGNLVKRTEWAQTLFDAQGIVWDGANPAIDPPSMTWPNEGATGRTTDYVYDKVDHKTSMTRESVQYADSSTINPATNDLVRYGDYWTYGNLTTTYGYDAVGNLVSTTDSTGASSYTYYDALGRVVAKADPAIQGTSDLGTYTASPVTEFSNDAFGNVVVERERSWGATSANAQGYTLAVAPPGPPVPVIQPDRTTYNLYDAADHVVQTTDADGINHYKSYNEIGKLAKSWQAVTDSKYGVRNAYEVYQYDKVGRLTVTIDPPVTSDLTADALAVSLTPTLTTQSTGALPIFVSLQTSPQLALTWTSFGAGTIVAHYRSMGTSTWTNLTVTSNGGTQSIANFTGLPTGGAAYTMEVEVSLTQTAGNPPAYLYTGKLVNVSGGATPTLTATTGGNNTLALNWTGIIDATAGPVTVSFLYNGISHTQTFNTPSQVAGGAQIQWYDINAIALNLTLVTNLTVRQVIGGTTVTVYPNGTAATPGMVSHTQTYNTFGEVIAKGVSGTGVSIVGSEYFDYDNAGRLWRTNTGGGVDKITLYDLQGNATSQLVSAGSASDNINLKTATSLNVAGNVTASQTAAAALTDVQRTDTYYDAMGRAVRTVLPGRLVTGESVDVSPMSASAAAPSSITTQGVTSHPGNGATVTTWNGTNQITVNVGTLNLPNIGLTGTGLSLLGGGDVMITVSYITKTYNVAAWSDNAGSHNGFTEQGVLHSFTQIFGADQQQGQSFQLSWADAAGLDGSMDPSTVAVVVSKKDVHGNWVTLSAEQTTFANGHNAVYLPAPTDGSTVQLSLSQNGTAVPIPPNAPYPNPANFGDLMYYDMSMLAAGTYQYTVTVTSPDGSSTRTADTGSFTVAKPALASIATTAFSISTAGVLTWTAPQNDRPTVSYRLASSTGAWTAVNSVNLIQGATTGGSTTWTTNLGALPAGTYNYELLYSHPTTAFPYTHATGQITVMGTTTKTFSITKTTQANSVAASLSDLQAGATLTQTATLTDAVQSVRPVVNKTYDRWGNVLTVSDPRSANWITTYAYDVENRVVRVTQLPQTVPGITSPLSPETDILYDKQGHQFGTVARYNYHADATVAGGYRFDYEVNLTKYDADGNLIEEDHADGGIVKYSYDFMGDKVKTVDAMNNTTTFLYDNMGRLVETFYPQVYYGVVSTTQAGTKQPQALTYDLITYDELGEKISEKDQAGNITHYRYDLRGDVVATILPSGQTTLDLYDAMGNKRVERDGNGYATVWKDDYFGRLIGNGAHIDLGGSSYSYAYDNAGHLTSQTSTADAFTTGESMNYLYNMAGQLIRVTRQITQAVGDVETTSYAYDLAGNRVVERTTTGSGVIVQDNRITYDSLGRMQEVADDRVDTRISYDLLGNRSHVSIDMLTDSGNGIYHSDQYFLYDKMNRQIVVGATNVGTAVLAQSVFDTTVSAPPVSQQLLGTTGHYLTYDKNGNRTSDEHFADKVIVKNVSGAVVAYNQVGDPIFATTNYANTGPGLSLELYTYDSLNQLRSVVRDGVLIDYRTYDAAGRVTSTGISLGSGYVTATGNDPSVTSGFESRYNTYDVDGKLLTQTVFSVDGTSKYSIDYTGGYDGAGNLKQYVLRNFDGSGYTNTYTYNYARFDSYEVLTIGGGSTTFGGGNTTNTYDLNGFLTKVTDAQQPESTRTFINDVGGRALYANQNNGEVQRQLIVNGEVIGRYGWAPDAVTPRDKNTGKPNFTFVADFSFGYQGITPNYPVATPGTYTIRMGDTLRSIAQGAYGDSSLWYVIADANGISSDSQLVPGQLLTIPNRVETVHNDSTDYKPYDPTKVTGDMTPFLPSPSGGCGGWGLIAVVIIAVAVAVVISVVTYGAAAPEMAALLGSQLAGAVAAGAIAGATASIFSQGVLNAAGVEKGISGKQILEGAVFGAIGGGLQEVMSGVTKALQAATLAGSIGSRTVATLGLVGEQMAIAGTTSILGKDLAHWTTDFKWRDVAIAATGAAVGSLTQTAMANIEQGMDEGLGRQLVTQTVRGMGSVAGSVGMAIVKGGKINYTMIAADAFGNALGGAIANEYERTRAQEAAEAFSQKLSDAANTETQIQRATRLRLHTSLLDLSNVDSNADTGGSTNLDPAAAFEMQYQQFLNDPNHGGGALRNPDTGEPLHLSEESTTVIKEVHSSWHNVPEDTYYIGDNGQPVYRPGGKRTSEMEFGPMWFDPQQAQSSIYGPDPIADQLQKPDGSLVRSIAQPQSSGLLDLAPHGPDPIAEELQTPDGDMVRSIAQPQSSGIEGAMAGAPDAIELPDLSSLPPVQLRRYDPVADGANTYRDENGTLVVNFGLPPGALPQSPILGASPATIVTEQDLAKLGIRKSTGILTRTTGFRENNFFPWRNTYDGFGVYQKPDGPDGFGGYVYGRNLPDPFLDLKTKPLARTPLANTPLSREAIESTIRSNNFKHLNIATLDSNLVTPYVKATRVVEPLIARTFNDVSVNGDAITVFVGVDHDDLGTLRGRARLLSSVNPFDRKPGEPTGTVNGEPDGVPLGKPRGYFVPYNTLDVFVEGYSKEQYTLAMVDYKVNGKLLDHANFTASGLSEEGLFEIGLRPSHRFAQATFGIEDVALKLHGDFSTNKWDIGPVSLSFAASLDVNLGALGVQGGVGYVPTDKGARMMAEVGASLGVGARTSVTTSVEPHFTDFIMKWFVPQGVWYDDKPPE